MLEESEFELIFEKNPLAQAIVDSQFRFIMVNEGFVRMIGYSKERLLTMKITDLRAQNLIKYLKDYGETFTDCVNQKRMTVGGSTWESPSGKFVVKRTNIPILDQSGSVKYVYIAYNDLTAEVKNQEYMGHEIDELSKIYARMAEGDLTPRYKITEPDADTKETYEQLVRLRDAVRGIIGNLQINIKDVNKRMQELNSTADAATRSMQDASIGISQVAKNASNVSEKSVKVSQNIDEILKAMQDMSAAVEEVASSMDSVSSQANGAKENAKTGTVLAENVNKGMKEITESSNNVYNVVKDIEKQMSEISKIIVLIRDIANQTNLLSLNAAIEAARAGEHGRGFAVVASEVKSLAQESRSSAEKIEDMIQNLNAATKKAIDAMEVSKTLVTKGLTASQEALSAFNNIQIAAETVAQGASDVASATEQQAATTEEITASAQEVAHLIDDTSKEASDAAAATEESASAIDEITRMIQNVNTVAHEALAANKKFKVE